MGLAATVLFVASANNGENMTQKEIATAAGLTTVTIRCRLKEISKCLDTFGNQEIVRIILGIKLIRPHYHVYMSVYVHFMK
jgi:Transcription factor TFIIB repeat